MMLTSGNIGISRRHMKRKLLPRVVALQGGAEAVPSPLPAPSPQAGTVKKGPKYQEDYDLKPGYLIPRMREIRDLLLGKLPLTASADYEYYRNLQKSLEDRMEGRMPVWPESGPQFDPKLVPILPGPRGHYFDPRLGQGDAVLMAGGGTNAVQRQPLVGQSTDTVPAMLTPKEAVLNRNAAELAGRGNIRALNQAGNALANAGVDLAGSPGRKKMKKKHSLKHGLMPRMLQGGTAAVSPIGYVPPEMVDPRWQEIKYEGGLTLADLKRLKEATEKKGQSAGDVASILSTLNQLGLFNKGTPYYGEGSSVSQALGPSLEAAFPQGYQGGTSYVPSWADPNEIAGLEGPDFWNPSTSASGADPVTGAGGIPTPGLNPTYGGGGTPQPLMPPNVGLVPPPGIPSVPRLLGPLPGWVKFIPGGQYAIAGRSLFNAGSAIGSKLKNLFAGARGLKFPSLPRFGVGGQEAGGGFQTPWQHIVATGGAGGLPAGGSYFHQLPGVRGGPLAGSFAGLGSGGGGMVGGGIGNALANTALRHLYKFGTPGLGLPGGLPANAPNWQFARNILLKRGITGLGGGNQGYFTGRGLKGAG